MQYKYSVNGTTYLIPKEQVDAFLQQFPAAQLIETVGDEVGKPDAMSQSALVEPETALNTESNLENTSLELPEEITTGEKIINSLKNVSLGIQGFDERLNVGFYTLSRNIFGDEAMDKFVEGKSDF